MKHIHLIGIGGTGISSIARVLLEKGYTVSGSDRVLSPLALDLQKAGVTIHQGHDAVNISGADIVVRSSAIPDDNPEVVAARSAGVQVMKRSDFLAYLMEDQKCIAIAGSHGKTTTSAMMAWTLTSLDKDPSYILGGVSKDLHGNAHAGTGAYFVIEADEYDHMFLGLKPHLVILTNVEYDHPDCYPTREEYHAAFMEFVNRIQPGGTLVTNADQDGAFSAVESLPQGVNFSTYGLSKSADFHAENLALNQVGGLSFSLFHKTTPLAEVALMVPGEHNVRNALAVLTASHRLGFSMKEAAVALSTFSGTGRRFDVIGDVHGITIIDDYAHHPSKIKATLSAARLRYPGRRIVAVWQPHTYSRTRVLEADFVDSLQLADLAIITDVYAAREEKQAYNLQQLVERVGAQKALHLPTLQGVTEYLLGELKPADVLIVLSAGDADQVCRNVLGRLKERLG